MESSCRSGSGSLPLCIYKIERECDERELFDSLYLRGDVVCNFKDTMSTSPLCVDNSLWDTLTCEMSKFIQQVEVLKKDWAIWSDRQGVLVVIEWSTSRSCDHLLLRRLYHLLINLINQASRSHIYVNGYRIKNQNPAQIELFSATFSIFFSLL